MSKHSEWLDRFLEAGWMMRILIGAIAVYLVIALVMGMFFSSEPEPFVVTEVAAKHATEHDRHLATGYTTTVTLIEVARTLLDKPGGYLSNDVMPPGLWLDNIPNWEFGVLVQVRDFSRALRKDFSRSQSQSTEDVDLVIVEPQFHFDNLSWALPDTEGEYRRGIEKLNNYALRLADKQQAQAQFFARADNLRQWLKDVETRLGSLSQRLSASVGQRRINVDLAGDTASNQSTENDDEFEVKTPWTEIDDVFYEARGTAWALIHILKALEVDFADVLHKKNALVSVRQIVRELEATQDTVWAPMILNGSGFGLTANHSLVMASYLSRANAGIIDLRALLSEGQYKCAYSEVCFGLRIRYYILLFSSLFLLSFTNEKFLIYTECQVFGIECNGENMDVAQYKAFVVDLEQRLQGLQNEYIADQNEDAQLIGPLLAITMLVKSDLLPFARDRYEAIVKGPQWKIADDHILLLRQDVESMLAGPVAFKQRKQGQRLKAVYVKMPTF